MSTKQEDTAGLAAPEPGEYGEAPETHVCEEGSIWDEEQQACVPESEVQPDLGAELGTSSEASPAVAESMMQAIVRTMKEGLARIKTELRAEQKRDLIRIKKELAGEAERSLRKSIGLEVDPVVHRSDLMSFLRKAQLEKAPTNKRSPASPGQTGPEGNTTKTGKTKEIESLFKQYKGEN